MKIRLSINEVPYSGYTNVDPCPIIEDGKEGQFEVYAGDFKDLDLIAETASCVEILAENVVDYVNVDRVIDVINHWVSKLRHGGRIIIKGVNLESLVKKFLNGELTTLDFNKILFGESNHPWQHKSGCINLEDVDETLRKAGLRVVHKKLDDVEYVIIGQRQ